MEPRSPARGGSGRCSPLPPPEQAEINTVAASAAALSQAATSRRTSGIDELLAGFKLSHVPKWACIGPDRMLPKSVSQTSRRLLQESLRCANANADRDRPLQCQSRVWALGPGLIFAESGHLSALSAQSPTDGRRFAARIRRTVGSPYRKGVIARGMITPTHPPSSPLQSQLTPPARALRSHSVASDQSLRGLAPRRLQGGNE